MRLKRFFLERATRVNLVLNERRLPALLYVRFAPDDPAVYVRLALDGTDHAWEAGSIRDGNVSPESPGSFVLALEEELLPRLPFGAALELTHMVEVEGRREVVPATELIQPVLRDGIWCADFTLQWSVDGTASKWEERSGLTMFADMDPAPSVTFKVCGACDFAQVPGYGGDEERHGLFCFRDDPEAFDAVQHRYPSQSAFEDVWRDVDAFHTCPSFKRAIRRYSAP